MSTCICEALWFHTEEQLARQAAKRHHDNCPLYLTEKHSRLFYYEDAVDSWTPYPGDIDCVVDVNCMSEGDTVEIMFKRIDMTDAEYDSMPQV